MIKILILILYLVSSLFAEFPEPYNSINVLDKDLHGWLRSENQKYLRYFIEKINPEVVVELGSWLGLSAVFMAKLLKHRAKVYAIDHWNPGLESYDGYFKQDAHAASKLPTLFQQFLSNIIHENLTKKIIPIRMNSLEAAKALNIRVNLIYIDAGHDEDEVYNDIISWYPKLESQGIMCGDDWFWRGVPLAVKKASEKLKIKFFHEGNFWYFEPKI